MNPYLQLIHMTNNTPSIMEDNTTYTSYKDEDDIEANNIIYIKSNHINSHMLSQSKPEQNKEGFLTSLCSYAMNKYGPTFTSIVDTILPYMDTYNHQYIDVDEYMNHILFHIDLEQGYTTRELEIMNYPLLDFVSNKTEKNTRINTIEHNHDRVDAILDSFYKEIQEESYDYA